MLVRLLNNPLIKTQDNNAETVPDISQIVKGGEIRDTKTLAQHGFVASFGRCFAFFTLLINLSCNKNICCGLKKVVAKCRAQVNFEQQILVLLLIFHQTRNKCADIARQVTGFCYSYFAALSQNSQAASTI